METLTICKSCHFIFLSPRLLVNRSSYGLHVKQAPEVHCVRQWRLFFTILDTKLFECWGATHFRIVNDLLPPTGWRNEARSISENRNRYRAQCLPTLMQIQASMPLAILQHSQLSEAVEAIAYSPVWCSQRTLIQLSENFRAVLFEFPLVHPSIFSVQRSN